MTLASVQAVSCPNCGAGLQILGGGRVTIHICSHCGSQLDPIENYRKLRTFANLHRPATPFSIGQKGPIHHVEWTIIGILNWRETHNGTTWNWIDHQLYSPTHGYAWLTLEDGHLLFSRRTRSSLNPPWISVLGVETAESRPTIAGHGTTYRYYDTSDSEVTFAEGEFTWQVAVGDRSRSINLLSPDAMLSLSQDGPEQEATRSVYLPRAETCAAFGVQLPKPRKQHPLEPFNIHPNTAFAQRLALISAALCLMLSLFFAAMDGSVVLPTQRIAQDALPAERSFTISDTHGLTTVDLRADVENAWVWVETTLTDPQGAPVFVNGREIGYYTGHDADGSWSEGSRHTQIRFHPPMPGEYTLELDVPEGGVDEIATGPRLTTLSVSVTSGGSSPTWTLLAAFVFAAIALLPLIRQILHYTAQWSGSDWTDED